MTAVTAAICSSRHYLSPVFTGQDHANDGMTGALQVSCEKASSGKLQFEPSSRHSILDRQIHGRLILFLNKSPTKTHRPEQHDNDQL